MSETEAGPVLEMEREFDARVAALEAFDACAWVGHPHSGPVAYPDPAALRAALERYGIRRAVVGHTLADLYEPTLGNRATAELLEQLPGCVGAMTLIPAGTGEIEDLAAAVDAWLAQGLRVARILPKHHRFTLSQPNVPPMLRVLEDRGVPLFIPIGQTRFDEIGPLAVQYPSLAILVEGTGHHEYLNIRNCLPWLERAPNLLVPTHAQFLCGGLELMVESLGADRVFFSTNQPVDDPACGLSLLAFSPLPLDVRRQIAHGNLDRLLASVGNGGYFA